MALFPSSTPGGSPYLSGGAMLSKSRNEYQYDKETLAKAQTFLGNLGSWVEVTATDASSDTAADFEGASLPTASTNLRVPSGKTLTIVADDEFSVNALHIEGGATLIIENGTAPGPGDYDPDGTILNVDTFIADPSSNVIIGSFASQGIIRIRVNCTNNIDVADDPFLISRSFLPFGAIRINGHRRQRFLPVMHDITGSSTTELTLGRAVFLGFGGSGGDTVLPIVLNPGDAVILPQTIPPATIGGTRTNEVATVSSFTLVENATDFSAKDTTGSTLTLNAAAAADHPTYYDETTRVAASTLLGPPSGSPTFESHVGWVGRPLVFFPVRNIKFEITTDSGDPYDSPAYRRPYFQICSSDSRLEFFSMQGWGRTDITQITYRPDEVTHTATVNLRDRHCIQAYNAGHLFTENHPQFVNQELDKEFGKKRAYIRGLSIYTDTVGIPQSNGTEGDASYSCGVAQHNSLLQVEDSTVYNTVGSPYYVTSPFDETYMIGNAALGCMSMGGLPGEVPVDKDVTYYSDGDNGRAGTGFLSMSRQLKWTRCISMGNYREGFLSLARSHEDIGNYDCRYMVDAPESGIFLQRQNSGGDDDRPPILYEGLYAFANGGRGVMVIKNSSAQAHGIRGLVVNCVGINNLQAQMSWQYTGNYVVERPLCLGNSSISGDIGFQLDLSAIGFSIIEPFIKNNAIGLEWNSETPSGAVIPSEELDHHVVNDTNLSDNTTDYLDSKGNGISIFNHTLPTPYDESFGFNITAIGYTTAVMTYEGVCQDAIGQTAFPFTSPAEDNTFRLGIKSIKGAIAHYGWYTNTDGSGPNVFTVYPFTFVNRLTRERLTVLYPIPRNGGLPGSDADRWELPSGYLIGGAGYQDKYLGEASYTAFLAAAQTAANNGVSFA